MEENNITYTQALNELEQIVKNMQAPDCSIDNLSQYTKRAKELLEICRAKLTATDTELKQLLADLEK